MITIRPLISIVSPLCFVCLSMLCMSPWLKNHRTVTFQAQTARLSTEVCKTLISKKLEAVLPNSHIYTAALEGASSRQEFFFANKDCYTSLEKHYMHFSRHQYPWASGNCITQKTFLSLRTMAFCPLTLALPPKTCNEICNCNLPLRGTLPHWPECLPLHT